LSSSAEVGLPSVHGLPAEWLSEPGWPPQTALLGKPAVAPVRGLWVLAAGEALKVLTRIPLGAKVYSSPVVANGTMYVATSAGWLWAVRKP